MNKKILRMLLMLSLVVPLTGQTLYWIDAGTSSIKTSSVDTYSGSNVLTGLNTPFSITKNDARIYWSETGSKKIQYINTDSGLTINTLLTLSNVPRGIAANDSDLWWIEIGTNKIRRRHISTTSDTTDIVTTGLVSPRHLIWDTVSSKLYWLDNGTGAKWIKRCNADGSNVETVVTGINQAWSFTIDPIDQKIYYVDTGADSVRYANYSGSLPAALNKIATGVTADIRGITYDRLNDNLYATNISADQIDKIVVPTGLITANVLPASHPQGIVFYAPFLATGEALLLDGINDYVQVPYYSALNPSTFTYELWARVDGKSGQFRSALSSRSGAGGLRGPQIYAGEDNHWQGWIGDGADWKSITGDTVILGAWTHLALTYNGTTQKFYVNGSLAGSLTTGYSVNTTTPFRLGSISDDLNYFFYGAVDEVRVWNVARTQSEIAADMTNLSISPSSSGVVALYKFNQGIPEGNNTGRTTLKDQTVNARYGTLINFALTGSTSNWISLDAPLPVELVSFTATTKGKNVELQWNTATEKNNYGFEIERRTPTLTLPLQAGGQGGGQWTKIGFIEGHGTTNAPQSYSFVDASAAGKVSYRLKQTDRDGKFAYSGEVEVMMSQVPSEFSLMQNYPNPFNPSTTISFAVPVSGFTTLKVFDLLGKEVATIFNGFVEAGDYNTRFDASKFTSGMYFYTLRAGNFVDTKKMLMVK